MDLAIGFISKTYASDPKSLSGKEVRIHRSVWFDNREVFTQIFCVRLDKGTLDYQKREFRDIKPILAFLPK